LVAGAISVAYVPAGISGAFYRQVLPAIVRPLIGMAEQDVVGSVPLGLFQHKAALGVCLLDFGDGGAFEGGAASQF